MWFWQVAIGFRRVKLKVKRKLRKPLMLTAAAYWVAAVLGLYAMQRLPLGNAQIILYTSPLLTYLLVRHNSLSILKTWTCI